MSDLEFIYLAAIGFALLDRADRLILAARKAHQASDEWSEAKGL